MRSGAAAYDQPLMLPPFHPHLDVWAVAFVLGFGYWYANARIKRHVAPAAEGPTNRQKWQWYGAVLILLLVSGWPTHDLGDQLFSVHMVEHMVLSLVVPALLLMGMPRWLADVTLGHPKVVPILRPLSRPVVAFTLFNATFIAIHWPDLVEAMLTNSLAHFGVHTWLFVVSGLMWMPVLSPATAIPRLRPPLAMFYLFAQSLLPTLPASFLTFSTVPLYAVYGNSALAFGWSPLTDQTVAGVIMKLGGGFLFWITIAVIWFRWTSRETQWEELETSLRSG